MNISKDATAETAENTVEKSKNLEEEHEHEHEHKHEHAGAIANEREYDHEHDTGSIESYELDDYEDYYE